MSATQIDACNVCDICFEQRTEFIYCEMSDKHRWCLSCNQSMIISHQEKCPFCRAPIQQQGILMEDDDDIPNIMPTLQRQAAINYVNYF